MLKNYVKITVIDGPLFRGFDECTMRWDDFTSLIEEYFDFHATLATLKIEVVQMTEEEFEAIEGDD